MKTQYSFSYTMILKQIRKMLWYLFIFWLREDLAVSYADHFITQNIIKCILKYLLYKSILKPYLLTTVNKPAQEAA